MRRRLLAFLVPKPVFQHHKSNGAIKMKNRQNAKCFICQNDEFGKYGDRKCSMLYISTKELLKFDCSICGAYEVSEIAIEDVNNSNIRISRVVRAAISHRFKLNTLNDQKNIIFDYNEFCSLTDNLRLPTPKQQQIALLEYINNVTNKNGDYLRVLPVDIHSIIGALDRNYALKLTEELVEKKWLKTDDTAFGVDTKEYIGYHVTAEGWEQLETNLGRVGFEKYGFLALEFGDAELEKLVKNTIKLVGKDIGYNIFDLREFEQAGIIDDILRKTIAGASFVVVDLTHDNPGAYWEAGYAEGLKKPVIYICVNGGQKESH